MKILQRYVIKTVLSTTLMVTVVFIAMISFIEFFTQLQDIGKGDYGILDALAFVPLNLPWNIYSLFPMAVLIGCLMGLGRMASRSELLVMRASGVSRLQIMKTMFIAGLIMVVIAGVFGEWLGPAAQQYSMKMKAEAISGGQTLQTEQGVWVRDGNNFIHIQQVLSNGRLNGITRYEFNNQHRLMVASVAESGIYKNNHWLFKNVRQSDISPEGISAKTIAVQQWNVSFKPKDLELTSYQPSQQNLWKLYEYIHYLKASGLQANQVAFNFWKRLFQPIVTLLMACLAVLFILGPLRTVTMGLRILIGVLFGMSFYLLNQFFGPFTTVFQIPPLFAAAFPTVLFSVIAGVLLWVSR